MLFCQLSGLFALKVGSERDILIISFLDSHYYLEEQDSNFFSASSPNNFLDPNTALVKSPILSHTLIMAIKLNLKTQNCSLATLWTLVATVKN